MPEELSLPRANEARVEQAKLTTYVLEPDHPTGRHKAHVFRSALGIGVEDWEDLRARATDVAAEWDSRLAAIKRIAEAAAAAQRRDPETREETP